MHFIVASCENMINGKAMRPGDVLTAANGKTVEVGAPFAPHIEAGARPCMSGLTDVLS